MSIRWIACPAYVEFTDTEYVMLSALPYPAHEIDRGQWCELEPGHDGPHCALGQVSFEESWWLRWDGPGGRREITALPVCAVEDGIGADSAVCTLPADHPGAHVFEYDIDE